MGRHGSGARWSGVVAAIVVAATSACTPRSGGDVPALAWEAPDSYQFVVNSSCGERFFLGTFQITVRNGAVVETVGLDADAERLLGNPQWRADIPSLSDLIAEARVARAEGADLVRVNLSEDGNYPTTIEIDWLANAIDDEACYRITEFDETQDNA